MVKITIFFILISILIFIYFGYYFLLIFISLFRKNAVNFQNNYFPFVSVIIAAYNEENIIDKKIKNTLKLDYPRDKLEIIVFSDASNDRTDEIVKEYQDKGVTLLRIKGRKGKTYCQNEAVGMAKGEIIVFSDANSIYRKDSLRKIIRNFSQPEVGCVVGELKYIDKVIPENREYEVGENIYWKYETSIKKLESKASSLVGANGAIYAIRKELYVPLPDYAISDFIEPIRIFKKGYKVTYEPEAIAYESLSDDPIKIYRRRVRIVTRTVYSLFFDKSFFDLFNPFKYGFFSIQLFSHKILRWFTGLFMMLIFFTNIFLLKEGLIYHTLFLFQILFYLLAIFGFISETYITGKTLKLACIIFYFCLSSIAMLAGIINVILGNEIITWETNR